MFLSLVSHHRHVAGACRLGGARVIPKRVASTTNGKENENAVQETGSVELAKTAAAIRRTQPNPLDNHLIPSENTDEPKKHVFQQITSTRLKDPIYTMDQAAAYRPSDNNRLVWKYPAIAQNIGYLEYNLRSWDNEYSTVFEFPDVTDLVVVGCGLVGSATAYYLKKTASRAADVVAFDRDPYSTHNETAICNGLISSQSKSQDVSRIAALSKELIRNLQNDVLVTPDDFAQINYRPCTHLILWPDHEVDDVMDSISMQIADGAAVDAKLPYELETTFPWLNAQNTDIAIGTHGNQDEALVDPIGLRNLYRTLAQAHGVSFIQAEALDFNTVHHRTQVEVSNFATGALICRNVSGELRQVSFAKILLHLGHNTPFLELKSEMEAYLRDSIEDLHFLQPKLRICIHFNSMMAPVINFPVITDTDGSMLIREDFAGNFKYYLTLEESGKFFDDDMERFMDLDSHEPYMNIYHRSKLFEDYFNNVIKPRLVKRIPVMEDAKFLVAHSGFESYNLHDGSPIMSLHPYHLKILVGGGYGKRMMNFAPLAAASFAELMLLEEERTFDMTHFYWDRRLKGRTIQEFSSLVN